MEFNEKAIGNVIRKLRERRKWSQTVLADFAGLSRSHLSEIENGLKSPNLSTLWRIAEAFDMQTSDMIRMAEEEIRYEKEEEKNE